MPQQATYGPFGPTTNKPRPWGQNNNKNSMPPFIRPWEQQGPPAWMQQRQKQTRQLPKPKPIQGGHLFSAAQKGFRFLYPEADRVARRFIGGKYEQPFTDAIADFMDRPGQTGMDIGLSAGIPGGSAAMKAGAGMKAAMAGMSHMPFLGGFGITRKVNLGGGQNMVEVLREGKKVGKLLYDDIPGTDPILYGIGTDPAWRGKGVASEALKDLHELYLPPERMNRVQISHIESDAEPFWKTWSRRNPDSPLAQQVDRGLEQKDSMRQWREQQAKKKSGIKKWLGLGAVPAAVGMGYYSYPQSFFPQPLYPQGT